MLSGSRPKKYPIKWRDIETWIAGALAIVFALLICVPWGAGPNGQVSDSCSDMVLHVAFASRMSFGHEIIWPFGPYGFLYSRSYHPATFRLTLIAWLWMTAACVIACWSYLKKNEINPFAALALLLLLIVASTFMLDNVFLLLPVLLVLHYFHTPNGISWESYALLIPSLALSFLVKFSAGLVGVILASIVGIDQVWKRRRPWVLLELGVCILAFWHLAGQRVSEILPFVRSRLLISAGYTSAMSLWGPWIEIIIFVPACILTYIWAALCDRKVTGRWRIVPNLAFGILLFLTWKAGFVRHDGHSLIANSLFFSLTMLFLARFWVPATQRILKVAGVVCLATSAWLLSSCLCRWNGSGLPSQVLSKVVSVGDRVRVVRILRGEPGRMMRAYRGNARGVMAKYPMPSMSGTVDIYPHGQTSLILHGLNFRPRPIFQSYLTYNSELSEVNAEFLRGSRAPDHIFLRIWPIDTRFPAVDDGLSWPELLARYDPRGLGPDMLILDRRPCPRTIRFHPVSSTVSELGTIVRVPSASNSPIWARLDVQPRLLGRLSSFLFKPPPLYVVIGTAAPTERTFTIIPDLVRGGFLLSPCIEGYEAFDHLYTEAGRMRLGSDQVVALRLREGWAQRLCYASRYRIEFWRLDIDDDGNAPAASWNPDAPWIDNPNERTDE